MDKNYLFKNLSTLLNDGYKSDESSGQSCKFKLQWNRSYWLEKVIFGITLAVYPKPWLTIWLLRIILFPFYYKGLMLAHLSCTYHALTLLKQHFRSYTSSLKLDPRIFPMKLWNLQISFLSMICFCPLQGNGQSKNHITKILLNSPTLTNECVKWLQLKHKI